MTAAVLRIGGWSRLVQPNGLLALAAMGAVLLAILLASIAFGSTWIPVDRVVTALLGGGQATDRLIVTQFRLPRALLAAQAGICLAVAGFLLQRATRNPLASPGVLGVVDGAGLGVVIFLLLFSDANHVLTVSIHWQPLAAALGGGGLLTLVFLAARGQVGSPIRLILFGVALAAVAKAAMTLFMITGPVFRASEALHWLAGSVHTAGWEAVEIVGAGAVPLLLLAAGLARFLDLLDLDDVTAGGLGLRPAAMRIVALLLGAALTSVAVAFVGGIGFVGLIAPHLAQRLLGHGSGVGMAGTALVGAAMVLLADLAVRVLFAPIEVPTGTVTAVVGAPYLLYLLSRRSRTDG